MSEAAQGWFAAVAGFGCFLLILPIAIRIAGGERRLVEVVVGVASVVFVVGLAWAWRQGHRDTLWSFIALYGFLFLSFMQAFAIILKSISLRILVEIDALPSRSLAPADVHRLLVVDGAYSRRLDGLEKSGLLMRREDTIRLTEAGRRVAERLLAIQGWFGIRQSG